MRTFTMSSFILLLLAACADEPTLPDGRDVAFAGADGKADGDDFEALPDGAYFAALTYRREADPLWRTRLLGGFAAPPVFDARHAVSLDLLLLPDGRYVARYAELVPRQDGGWAQERDREVTGGWSLAGDGKIALAGLGVGARATYGDGTRRAPAVTLTFATDLASRGLAGRELMVIAVRSTAPFENL